MLIRSAALALCSLVLAGCGDDSGDATTDQPAATSLSTETTEVSVDATFAPYADGVTAVVYDPTLIPAGASAEVEIVPHDEGTTFELTVSGLTANHHFGAHLHVQSCGADPGDAGPHYQDRPDPTQPSTDSAYANPENEVWLDVMTNAQGNGSATSEVTWTPRPGEAGSVVIHAEHTMTDDGYAGAAGNRLACVNVAL